MRMLPLRRETDTLRHNMSRLDALLAKDATNVQGGLHVPGRMKDTDEVDLFKPLGVLGTTPVMHKYSPDQPRDDQGQWTSGGAAALAIGGAVVGGGVLGAAVRYGPRAARMLVGALRPKPTPKFRTSMRRALAADINRAKPVATRMGTYTVGDAEAALARAWARRRAQHAARRVGRQYKRYRKYSPDQPRDEEGQWAETGAGGGSSGASSARTSVTTAAAGLGMQTPQQAHAALKQSVAAYDTLRKIPKDSGVWRDPTWLDKAWDTYASAMTLFGLGTALAATTSTAAFAGVVVGGAHVAPTHAAIGTALMSLFPNMTKAASYAAATKYLKTLFPSEAKLVASGARGLIIAGAAAAGTGALLGTALALRYAYRRIATNGEYQGVSSINARMKEIDGHLEMINNRLGVLTTTKRLVKYNPDQPRDEKGQWTSGGGSGGYGGAIGYSPPSQPWSRAARGE